MGWGNPPFEPYCVSPACREKRQRPKISRRVIFRVPLLLVVLYQILIMNKIRYICLYKL
jgi:hypothetical protein